MGLIAAGIILYSIIFAIAAICSIWLIRHYNDNSYGQWLINKLRPEFTEEDAAHLGEIIAMFGVIDVGLTIAMLAYTVINNA